jgi:hypothetical protein
MSLSESILHIKLGDLKALEEKISALSKDNARLQGELVEAKLGTSDSLCREYHKAFLDAMPVVRFAVGNMDPMSFRGWPHRSLTSIAAALSSLPGVDADQQETAGDLKIFASDCAMWEGYRAQGIEQEMLEAMNAARAPIEPAS